jgi:hypothetical protein
MVQVQLFCGETSYNYGQLFLLRGALNYDHLAYMVCTVLSGWRAAEALGTRDSSSAAGRRCALAFA